MMQKANRLENPQDVASFGLGWLCGAIECDGSISLNARLYSKSAIGITPYITLTNLNPTILDYAQTIAQSFASPGHRYQSAHKYAKTGIQHRLEWVGVKRCKAMLDVILPCIIGKKAQAEVVYEFCLSRLSVSPKARFSKRDYELLQQSRAIHGCQLRNPQLAELLNDLIRGSVNSTEDKV